MTDHNEVPEAAVEAGAKAQWVKSAENSSIGEWNPESFWAGVFREDASRIISAALPHLATQTDHNEVPQDAALTGLRLANKFGLNGGPGIRLAAAIRDAILLERARQPPTEPTRAEDAPHVEPGGEREKLINPKLAAAAWARSSASGDGL